MVNEREHRRRAVIGSMANEERDIVTLEMAVNGAGERYTRREREQ